jgi:hypothetical protein
VIDAAGASYVIGGSFYDGNVSLTTFSTITTYYKDVWVSTDGGA